MVTKSATSKEDAMDGWWNDIDRDVNVVLERHGSMTPAEIARMLRLSEGAVSSVLSMLAQEGKLRIARVELPPRDDGRQLSL
jgi:DNA-binding Lrp family transcriptional regulator